MSNNLQTLTDRIVELYKHFADKGYNFDKAKKSNPTDIAYWYTCECFCQGWGLDNGEKALYSEVVECGIATVCIQHKVKLDNEQFKEEDYIEACRDAINKVLKMYKYY